MRSILKNEFMLMSLDEDAPILFTEVRNIPEGSIQFHDFCKLHQSKLMDIASKNEGISYSICDTSSLQPYSFDLLINFYIRFIRKSKEIFRSHKIFVLPKLTGSLDVNEMFKLSAKNAIYFFDTLEEAKKSVYDDWSLYKKTILNNLTQEDLLHK